MRYRSLPVAARTVRAGDVLDRAGSAVEVRFVSRAEDGRIGLVLSSGERTLCRPEAELRRLPRR